MAIKGLDSESLKKRYADEREKRITQGDRTYISVPDEYPHYMADPFLGEVAPRDSVAEDIDVVVIGGGLGGIESAAHMRKQGFTDIRVIDSAADFGGVWYFNRYPGAQCDVESYVYLPFLEETGYMPKERYSYADEIRDHFQRVARHFGLYDKALFQTTVLDAVWNEERCRWTIRTNRGDCLSARFLFLTVGSAHLPKLPRIPGIDRFKGKSFHTARWDFHYTGGDLHGGLTGLADKRVAVIGTGATAVQVVPKVAVDAQHLYVIQRTPSSIDIRGNRKTDPAWAASLSPGWQRDRMLNFEENNLGMSVENDLVDDSWTRASRRLLRAPRETAEVQGGDLTELMVCADMEKMEELRQRVAQTVKNPATAEALKPWFNLHCKRPCYHDEYLEAFNRDNVELIDTQGRGVDEITEHHLVIDGKKYPVDCIIFSTGFEMTAPPFRAGQMDIIGTNGMQMADHWSGGIRTVHGMFVHQFPNLAIIAGIRDGGGTFNTTVVADEQASHAAWLFRRCIDDGKTRIEATASAEQAWRDLMRSKNVVSQSYLQSCTPSYLNGEGTGSDTSLRVNVYGGGTLEYFDHLENARRQYSADYFTVD